MFELSLTSMSYIVFVVIGILLVYLVKKEYQWIVLLGLSAVFFWIVSGPASVVWLLGDALIAYVGALFNERATKLKQKKRIVTITVILLLAELYLLKYIHGLPLVAPIAISFYTLSLLAYVLDVHWGVSKAEKNPARFLLYACYFPQMTSGPINRYRDLAPQFEKGNDFDYIKVKNGLLRIAFGVMKKCMIADQVCVAVDRIFGDPKAYQGSYILLGAMLFALQLYTDFSGCMDIILGTSACFGVTLPENFEIPFSSQTMSEFWRRWHITLGVWFKEYLMYPLLKSKPMQDFSKACIKKFGRKKGKKYPTYVGLLVVWFWIGYWHGGALHYVIGSGLLHYFYIVSGELLEPHVIALCGKLKINREAGWYVLLRRLKVFFLVCSGFVFFRSVTTKNALYMYKCLLLPEGGFLKRMTLDSLGFSGMSVLLMCVAFLLMCTVSLMKEKGKEPLAVLEKQNVILRYLVYLFLIMILMITQIRGFGVDVSSFIYNKF